MDGNDEGGDPSLLLGLTTGLAFGATLVGLLNTALGDEARTRVAEALARAAAATGATRERVVTVRDQTVSKVQETVGTVRDRATALRDQAAGTVQEAASTVQETAGAVRDQVTTTVEHGVEAAAQTRDAVVS